MKKQKITEKQFILIIDGPSCGGKSTTANVILDTFGGIFDAKSDQIKWLISDYDSSVHRDIVTKMTMEAARIALKNEMSILRQGIIYGKEELLQLAKDFDVPIFVANVSAPKEVLEKRFIGRIEAKKKGAKISNTDPKRFWELCDMQKKSQIDSPLEFDSSVQTPEEIACAIVNYIKDNV